MFSFLALLTALHAIPGIFWAGTTFAIVRSEGEGAEKLAEPQVGAGFVTLLAGVTLWHFRRGANFGASEAWLALGVGAAMLALGVQVYGLNRMRSGRSDPRTTLALQRAAALLLIVTVFVMTTSRYA